MKNLEKLSILELLHYINWCETEISSTDKILNEAIKLPNIPAYVVDEYQGLSQRHSRLILLKEELSKVLADKTKLDLELDACEEYSYRCIKEAVRVAKKENDAIILEKERLALLKDFER